MNNIIKKIKTTVKFTFSNGSTYELPLVNKNYMTENLKNYGTSLKIKEQLYTVDNKNIIGNVCGNTLALELVSLDKLLISSNAESMFFGYMNNTAIVDVYVYVENDKYTEYMGRYFVDTWENGATNSTSNNVSISCIDLMSKIKNISLNKIRLKRNLSINTYLKTVIDTLNKQLSPSMQIKYTDDDLNIFKNSDYDWQVYFNNIVRDNIETIFNTIAQNTLSYIWINRNRNLKTDHLLDDDMSEAVSSLSGSSNLFEYGVQSDTLNQYSGVNVNYISNMTYEDKEVASLNNYELKKNNNIIENINLNCKNVINIHHIKIECDEGKAVCISVEVFKDKINIIVKATKKCKANIKIFGSVVNYAMDKKVKYIDNNNKNDLAEIENLLLRKEIISTYTDGLVKLMSMKNARIYAQGYINPRIKLGDLVTVTGTKLNIADYYKVIGLEFTFGAGYRCKADLIKTVELKQSVDTILYNQADMLLDVLNGDTVNVNNLQELSEDNEIIVQDVLNNELSELSSILKGV